jgi:hypothetical protein
MRAREARQPALPIGVHERARVERADDIAGHRSVVVEYERELRAERQVRAGVDVAGQVRIRDQMRRIGARVAGPQADLVDGVQVVRAIRADRHCERC